MIALTFGWIVSSTSHDWFTSSHKLIRWNVKHPTKGQPRAVSQKRDLENYTCLPVIEIVVKIYQQVYQPLTISQHDTKQRLKLYGKKARSVKGREL